MPRLNVARHADAVRDDRGDEELPALVAPPGSAGRGRPAVVFERAGRLLAALFEHGGTMVLSVALPEPYSDESIDVSLSLVSGDGRRVTACRESLLEALEAGGCRVPSKRCLGPCGRVLPLARFARNRTTNDGHVKRCRECEKRRVAEYDAKYREVHGHKRLTK